MHAVVSPTFLKRCTTSRGMKTMAPGPTVEVWSPTGQLIGALEDEEHFFLPEMDVVGRALAGFVAPHEDRDGTTGGLGGEEDFHVEAEGLDRQRLFGLDDGGLHR